MADSQALTLMGKVTQVSHLRTAAPSAESVPEAWGRGRRCRAAGPGGKAGRELHPQD